ncbi:MAG: hypothetical protein OXC30_06090 [Alphaproteobacteria bacterium]|nr:hypothetical protein [Alphaproteobacteria bacterium]
MISHRKTWWVSAFAYGMPLGLGYNAFIRFLPIWLKQSDVENFWLSFTNLLVIPFILRSLPFAHIWKSPTTAQSFLCIIGGAATVALATPANPTVLFLGAFVGCWGVTLIETANGAACLRQQHLGVRARFKSAMFMGYRVGGLISKSLCVLIASVWGWFASYSLVVCLLFGIWLLLIFSKKWNQSLNHEPLDIKSFFTNKDYRTILLSAFFLFPDALFDTMLIPFWMDMQVSLTHIAWAKGLLATVGASFGILMALRHLKKKSIREFFKIIIPWNIVSHMLPIFFTQSQNIIWVYVISCIAHISHGMLTCGYLVYMVSISKGWREYDLYLILWYLTIMLSFSAGPLLSLLNNSWTLFFIVVAQLNWVSLWLLRSTPSTQNKNKG